MARVSALAQHREQTAAARAAACYRCGCPSPAAVLFIDPTLAVVSACRPHGLDLWDNLGGTKAEAAGRFGVARVGGGRDGEES